jgi:thiol-disulfide isomerase/thioredoxin
MIFITREEELQIDLRQQSLYFYSSWIPFHKKILTMISQMEEKNKNMLFYAIDVDQFANQCKRFSINSIPTILILQSGKEIKRLSGLTSTSIFKSAYADICIF